MRLPSITFFCVAFLAGIPYVLAQGGTTVKPLQRWSGKIGNNDLLSKAPKSGVLTEAKAFEQLWKAWRGDEKVPQVDFAKNIVVVQVAPGGPNVPSAFYKLSDAGDLQAKVASTLIAGPGFGYSLDVLSKEKVKTYQGKKIE